MRQVPLVTPVQGVIKGKPAQMEQLVILVKRVLLALQVILVARV